MFWPLNILPRFDGHPRATDLRFDGQTILLTAASGGVGLAAARSLAERGPSTLIVTARTKEKAEVTKTAIDTHIEGSSRIHPAKRPDVIALVLEMNDPASILSFVKALKSCTDYLDHAILSSAVMVNKYTANPFTGYEESIHVNAIAPIFLSTQLIPFLLNSSLRKRLDPRARPHLTFITSGGPWRVDMSGELNVLYNSTTPLADLSKPSNFATRTFAQYERSKLMLEHAMRRFAYLECFEEKSAPIPLVLIGSATTGAVATDIIRHAKESVIFTVLVALFGWVRRRPEVGANIYVSSLGNGVEARGEQWVDDAIASGDKVKNVKSDENIRLGDAVWAEMKGILSEMDDRGDGPVAKYLQP